MKYNWTEQHKSKTLGARAARLHHSPGALHSRAASQCSEQSFYIHRLHELTQIILSFIIYPLSFCLPHAEPQRHRVGRNNAGRLPALPGYFVFSVVKKLFTFLCFFFSHSSFSNNSFGAQHILVQNPLRLCVSARDNFLDALHINNNPLNLRNLWMNPFGAQHILMPSAWNLVPKLMPSAQSLVPQNHFHSTRKLS